MKQKLFVCRHCGNIVAMIQDAGVPIMCCGEKMHEVKPGNTEASGEKHIPVYEVDGNIVHVTVGSVEHPMTQEHDITWICLVSEHGIQYAHLDPNDKPKAKLPSVRVIRSGRSTPSAINMIFGRNREISLRQTHKRRADNPLALGRELSALLLVEEINKKSEYPEGYSAWSE